MVWCRSLVVCIPGQSRVAVSFDASELASVGLLVAKLSIPQSVLDGGVSFVAGGKLYKAPDETFPQHVSRVDLHVSMCGGKGGFGALLRGGPGGLRTRKTTNFDACRDLSGRRLRHAKAEERLRDWAVKQMEKEKAKQAEAAAKKADKMLHKQQVVHAFAEESQQLSERTATALQRGLEAKKKIQLMMAREEAKRELASKAQQNPWDVDGDDQQEEDDEGYEDEEEINKDEDFVIHDQGRVTCDVCDCVIVGQRFHSVTRDDYDLCESCHAKAGAAPGEFILVIQTLPEEPEEPKEPETKRLKE